MTTPLTNYEFIFEDTIIASAASFILQKIENHIFLNKLKYLLNIQCCNRQDPKLSSTDIFNIPHITLMDKFMILFKDTALSDKYVFSSHNKIVFKWSTNHTNYYDQQWSFIYSHLIDNLKSNLCASKLYNDCNINENDIVKQLMSKFDTINKKYPSIFSDRFEEENQNITSAIYLILQKINEHPFLNQLKYLLDIKYYSYDIIIMDKIIIKFDPTNLSIHDIYMTTNGLYIFQFDINAFISTRDIMFEDFWRVFYGLLLQKILYNVSVRKLYNEYRLLNSIPSMLDRLITFNQTNRKLLNEITQINYGIRYFGIETYVIDKTPEEQQKIKNVSSDVEISEKIINDFRTLLNPFSNNDYLQLFSWNYDIMKFGYHKDSPKDRDFARHVETSKLFTTLRNIFNNNTFINTCIAATGWENNKYVSWDDFLLFAYNKLITENVSIHIILSTNYSFEDQSFNVYDDLENKMCVNLIKSIPDEEFKKIEKSFDGLFKKTPNKIQLIKLNMLKDGFERI